jgi:ribosomal protein S18 acetylase RimI-like enzyme
LFSRGAVAIIGLSSQLRLEGDAISELSAVAVRTASPDDADAIARVHIGTWQAAYAHIFPAEALDRLASRLAQRAEFWQEAIASGNPRSHTLVGQERDRVVGFASIGPTRDDDLDPEQVGELFAIYVLPEAWGEGVGRALMRELVARLRKERFRAAILWVLEDNPRTRRFYELAGWRLDGAVREETILDTAVREVRYRIALL